MSLDNYKKLARQALQASDNMVLTELYLKEKNQLLQETLVEIARLTCIKYQDQQTIMKWRQVESDLELDKFEAAHSDRNRTEVILHD